MSVHEVLWTELPSGPLDEPDPDADPPLEPDELDDPDASSPIMPLDDEPLLDDEEEPPLDPEPLPPELELGPESLDMSTELPVPPIGPHPALVKKRVLQRRSARVRFATRSWSESATVAGSRIDGGSRGHTRHRGRVAVDAWSRSHGDRWRTIPL
jgi:hypothetical protein